MMDTSYFHEKTVLITGASSGIGRSLAEEIVPTASCVWLCGRRSEVLEEMARTNESFRVCSFDISDRESVKSSLSEVSHVDIVICNAGTCEYVDYPAFESEVIEHVFRTNLFGTMYVLEALLPILRCSLTPHLVVVSSSVAYLPLPRAEAYGASKAALNYFLDALRISMGEDAFPVTTVCPGFVRTPLTDRNDFPMPMIIEPEDAARAICMGIAQQRSEIHFPKAFTSTLKLLAFLPKVVQRWILKRTVAR